MIFRLRLATLEDEPVLEEIERACFPSCHWTAQDFREHDCVVVEYEGRVAGFVVSREVYSGNEAEPREIEILNLAVLPAFRRLGFARALLNDMLAQPGVYFLEVRESNRPAQCLYQQFGFSQISLREDYYELPNESAIVMRFEQC